MRKARTWSVLLVCFSPLYQTPGHASSPVLEPVGVRRWGVLLYSCLETGGSGTGSLDSQSWHRGQ